MTDPKRVIVLGGYGSFGQLISQALVSQRQAHIVVVGRNQQMGQAFADSVGAQFVQCDIDDARWLRQVLTGAYLVINAAGPFQNVDYTVPLLSLECDCHYIDLGDGRAYVANIGELLV